MKMLNVSRRRAKQLVSSGVAVAAVTAGAAYAELPAAVATEIATVKADISTAGGLIIGLAVVAMGIRWVKATFF